MLSFYLCDKHHKKKNKQMTTGGKHVYFSSDIPIRDSHEGKSGQKFKAGNQKQELKPSCEGTGLAPHDLLSMHFYISQEHLSWVGTTYGVLGPPTHKLLIKRIPAGLSKGQCYGGIFSLLILLSKGLWLVSS